MNSLAKLLEAALFASPRPIPAEELAALDPEASPAAVQSALDELREHYDVDGHGVALVPVADGWQILTRPEYTEAIERAQMAVRPQRLSAAALETRSRLPLHPGALSDASSETVFGATTTHYGRLWGGFSPRQGPPATARPPACCPAQ